MLLIDGVRYEEWTPKGPQAEEEFEKLVGDHASEIFGADSKYFDLKHKLISKSGTGSIPDGYVISLGNTPQLHIIEFELASHDIQHIMTQVVNIMNGIENPATQQKICNVIEDEMNRDEVFGMKLIRALKTVSVHRFLADCLIKAPPPINVIIDRNPQALGEALNKITPAPRVIEFRTFKKQATKMRDGVIDVRPQPHAHLFELLNEIKGGKGSGNGGHGRGGRKFQESTEELLAKYGSQPFNKHSFKGTLQQAWDIRDHPPTGDRNNWTYDIRVELLKLAGLK